MSKAGGGLGVRNLLLWYEAAVGKHVWDIEQKADNLGVKWVHTVYIKNGMTACLRE